MIICHRWSLNSSEWLRKGVSGKVLTDQTYLSHSLVSMTVNRSLKSKMRKIEYAIEQRLQYYWRINVKVNIVFLPTDILKVNYNFSG